MDMMPESMGYDRAIVVFSPDGRLFQVEYAREAVKRGATAVGVTFKDGVVFAVQKRESKLVTPGDKIFQIDKHMAVAASGLVADARILVDSARVKAQQNKMIYDEPVSTTTLARFLADKQQLYTQYAGVRPYGVSFLVGGVNHDATLYETDPSGVILNCKARAIGKSADKINEFFEKEFKDNFDVNKAAQLAINGLKKDEKIHAKNIVISVIDKDGYKSLTHEEIKKLNLSF